MTKLVITCPMCGMWSNPQRFRAPIWPIRAFHRTMGGREPGSKRGIIRHSEIEVPKDVIELVIDEHLELAERLGIESGPNEERGLTKNLWEDPLAFVTGAAATTLQVKANVPPLVMGVAESMTGLALARGGNALGGTGGAAATTTGLSLLALGGGDFTRTILDKKDQPGTAAAQMPFILVPVRTPGVYSPPGICTHCGKPTSATNATNLIGFF